ncbi:MAG: hypothetical protein Q4F66_04410 [Clostridium sp.]|nr:hypothetical protein [Clostridium sp.]
MVVNIDRNLIFKILGRKDSVDLGDMIFNLRGICNDLRKIDASDINENFLSETQKKLNDIYKIINPISERLKSSDSISGYINSRNYLSDFTNVLCTNVMSLARALDNKEVPQIIHYNNIIIDLILKY